MSNVDNQKQKNNLPLTLLFVFTIHNPNTTIIMDKCLVHSAEVQMSKKYVKFSELHFPFS